MTVSFTEKPVTDLLKPDLDSLLLPQLRSRHGSTEPDAVLLRVLCRGLSTPGVSAAAVQRWLLVKAKPELQAIVANPNRFFRLVALARTRAAVAGTAAGAAATRLQTTRRGMRLAAAGGAGALSLGQEAKCRVALAIIVNRQVGCGWDKVRVTAPWLGARMNLSTRAAGLLLRSLEHECAWIRRVGSRGGALDWRLSQIRGDDAEPLRDFTWLHAGTIDAWAAADETDRFASLLLTADHPAWHYALDSSGLPILGARAFIAAVHSMSGLPADEPALGLPVRARSKLLRAIETHLPGAMASGEWRSALDDLAAVTGAVELRAARDLRAAAEAAENRVRVEAFRQVKAAKLEQTREVGKLFRAAFHIETGVLGPIPRDGGALTAWTSLAAQHWNAGAGAGEVGPELVEAARELLERNVVAAGHDLQLGEKVGLFVFRPPVAA